MNGTMIIAYDKTADRYLVVGCDDGRWQVMAKFAIRAAAQLYINQTLEARAKARMAQV